ncbi:hypothetical protein F5Y16DRAFT_403089 [Xylariaceae sp. FL0255]|nr:hypothetical protein F5Y16DRAFT_403089 [Xylariaceae sp. FL0255]
MNPLAALGVAANIYAFVDIGINSTKKLTQYTKAEKLESPAGCPHQLNDLLKQCRYASTQLFDLINKVKIKDPEEWWGYVQGTKNLLTKRSEIAVFDTRLDSLRSQLMLNGLDEFEGDAVGHRAFAEQFKTWANKSGGPIVLCVSSRPHTQFTQTFESIELPSSLSSQRIHLQKLTQRDFKRNRRATFANDPDWEILDVLQSEAKDIVAAIIGRADGVFFGLDSSLGETGRGAHEADELYDKFLGSIKQGDRRFTNQVLFTVLSNLFYDSLNEQTSNAVKRVITHLRGWSGGLVEIERAQNRAVDFNDPTDDELNEWSDLDSNSEAEESGVEDWGETSSHDDLKRDPSGSRSQIKSGDVTSFASSRIDTRFPSVESITSCHSSPPFARFQLTTFERRRLVKIIGLHRALIVCQAAAASKLSIVPFRILTRYVMQQPQLRMTKPDSAHKLVNM